MRALVLGPPERERIKQVMAFAEAHRFTVHDLWRVMAHPEDAPGCDLNFCCVIPLWFKCVFTIDQQPKGWMRHLSVSVLGNGWPHEKAVEMLGVEFGFKTPFKEWHKFAEKEARAVNVLELYES